MVGPAAKREAVAHLQAVMGLSERRACSFVGADRKMFRYQSSRPPETELRGRLRDLGPVTVWCRFFDHVMCSKGDELWGQAKRMNFARMRCGSR